jgi:hypothetical protein
MRGIAIPLAIAVMGCATGPIEVRRTASPTDTPRLAPRLRPSAILHGNQRTPIPAESTITTAEVAFTNETRGIHVHKLMAGDIIEADEDGRILAVRSQDNVETRFVPGSATSPPGSDEVRGKLAEGRTAIALADGDRIELVGMFAPGERVPGGGHIESSGNPAFAVLGLVTLAVGYAPSLYVGATSSLTADRVLLVPVLGPWIDLATRPSCTTDNAIKDTSGLDTCSPERVAKAGLIAAGSLEALGTLLFFVGLPNRAVFVEDKRSGLKVEAVFSASGASIVGRF